MLYKVGLAVSASGGGWEGVSNARIWEREKKKKRKERSEVKKKDHGMEDWQLSQSKNQIWRRKKEEKGNPQD